MRYFLINLLVFVVFLRWAWAQCVPESAPVGLRVEGAVSPLSVSDPTPEVSATNTSSCTVTGAVLRVGLCSKPADWVGNFLYRKPITVVNSTASDLVDFQIKVENPLWNESALVLSYHFESLAGGVVHDFSGFANHGFLQGNVSPTQGRFGQGVTLDGVSDWIAISSLVLAGAGSIPEITVCAWIKTDDDFGIILSFDRSEYFRLAVGNVEAGVPGVIHWATTADGGTGTHDLQTVQTFNDGRWHFVCGWFKAGANPDKKIYVDGVVVASALAHPGATGLGDDGSGIAGDEPDRFGFIGVGSEASSFNGTRGPTAYFRGVIDEVKVYFRALSDEEIRALFVPKAHCPESTAELL